MIMPRSRLAAGCLDDESIEAASLGGGYYPLALLIFASFEQIVARGVASTSRGTQQEAPPCQKAAMIVI